MDLHKQHGKQPGKNIKPEKGESNNTSHTKKKEEQIRCGLVLFSFEDEDEWYINNGFPHHMVGDKEKIEFLK